MQFLLSIKGMLFIGVSGVLFSCASSKTSSTLHQPGIKLKTDSFLENLLRQHPDEFNHILKQRDTFRVQIIYTQIDRNIKNKPVFKNYYFNVDQAQYYYPASTVKLPVALLSLEWLKELDNSKVNPFTTMITGKANQTQTEVFNDPTSEDGRPTIAHYIKKILLVSDNDAFNRLYELLGPEYINKTLVRKGFTGTKIVHRLSLPLSPQQNLETNPVLFFDTSLQQVFAKPNHTGSLQTNNRKIFLGRGFIQEGQLVNQPFDFSAKNKMSLEDLHRLIQSIMFPESIRKRSRFKIDGEDYRFVRQYMSEYPSESSFPQYDSSSYYDGYVKFLLWGSGKETLPRHLRIFNKVGVAYGFLTDAAYIVDFDKNVEFMLTASIFCNNDGIFNDDRYDYDTIGFPFMKNLGRMIYDYELVRQRSHIPDLKQFKLEYK